MSKLCKDMLKIYRPYSGLDWMNYRINNSKDLTFHHIIKKEDGGIASIDNGALLVTDAHQYLHIIECIDYNRYIVLNRLFDAINKQLMEPNASQREMIEYLLGEFEYIHKKDRNSKGRTLIKREYLKRY